MSTIRKVHALVLLATLTAAGGAVWFLPFHKTVPYSPTLAFSHTPAPTPQDLIGLTPIQAKAVIDAMNTVFKYFSFGTIGQRYPGQAPPEVAQLAGGECDGTVEALRRLLKGVVTVENLDLVVPKGTELAGHTIGYIQTPQGHILLGSTFGLIFVHVGNMNVKTAFHEHAYRVYSVGISPQSYIKALGSRPADYYGVATAPRTSFALPDETISAKTPPLDIGKGLNIGTINNDEKDIVSTLGSYHAALGNRYRKTLEIFRFKGNKSQLYKATFVMKKIKVPPELKDVPDIKLGRPLHVTVAIADDAHNITKMSDLVLDDHHLTLTINLEAPSDIFDVRFATDELGCKLLDMISIAPIQNGGEFTKIAL